MARIRIRSALVAAVATVAVAAPLSSTAHYDAEPCNGLVTAHAVGDQVIYTDDRTDAPGEVEGGVPVVDGAYWVYLEDNGHGGLQSGGSHAILGEGADDVGFSDSCKSNHGIGNGNGRDSILF